MKVNNVAIPVFNKRVSPLLNVSSEIKIFSLFEDNIEKIFMMKTSGYSEEKILSALVTENVNTLICSAVSRCFSDRIVSSEIKLISGIIGNCEEVIEAFIYNGLKAEKFIMPGCRGRGRGMGRGNCQRLKK